MGVARMHLTLELLRELLHLPYGTEIRAIDTIDFDRAELTIAHSDIKAAPLVEGVKPPLITPTWRRNPPVEFIEWGQP